jgi:hypothetical protein
LLRVLLNRHPNIAICDETYFFYWVFSRRRAFGALSDAENRRKLVDAYLSTWRIERLGLDRSWLAERLLSAGSTYTELFASLIAAYAESRSKERAGEKTPEHALHVETLLKWFPAATIVHVIRDPRDVVASLHRMPWGRSSTAANAEWWTRLVSAAQRVEGLPSCSTVRYEDLVHEPESVLRSLCRRIQEPYVPELLSMDSADTEVADRSWFRRAYEPLSRSRVALWTTELTERQVRVVEWVAGPLMTAYGYDPSLPAAPSILKAGARLHHWWESGSRTLIGLPRIWHRWLHPTNLVTEESWIDGRSR